MHKTLLTVFLSALNVFVAMADQPFRNHRYDGFKILEVNSKSIVFVGNSITNMHEWWEAFGNHNVVNRGVSGAVSPEMLANLEDVLTGHPAKIFFMIGTNDLGTAGLNTAVQVAGNIRTALQRCRTVSPSTRLYVQSILPSGQRDMALQQQTNDSIRKICDEFKDVTYIDLWDALLPVATGTHTLDRLHLAASGYAIWCNAIREYVNGPGGATVYPETETTNSFGGLGGSNGMRTSCFRYYPITGEDVLMIGDEMIHGGEWHELFNSGKVKNRGTGWGFAGATINLVKAQLPNIFHGTTMPAQVCLYVGMADAYAGNFDLEVAKNDYAALVAAIQDYAPNAKIHLLSLLPNTKDTDIVPLNAEIRKIAEGKKNVAYIDLYTGMLPFVGDTAYFNGNYVYGLGYAKIANLLAPKLDLTAITMEQAEATREKSAARNKLAMATPSAEVFGSQDGNSVPYRIPGLAQAQNGNIIAVADYRYSGADIGMAANGKLDIRGRISKDNGKTWGDIFTIAHGTGAGGTGIAAFNNAFGDPCIVADRTSSKVLMLSCAGNVSFPNGTDSNHQDIAYFLSEDNGETWTAPQPITAQFYDQLRKGARGPVRAMFIGSGKIHQSRYTKVGEYYRLYCSTLVKDVDGTHCNYVYYSDDFGKKWTVLGTADMPAIPGGTDEPKTEELPDGSLVCSGRSNGGRWLNVFTFTDAARSQGSWGTAAFSGSANYGTYGASCNGEILIVPATRKHDNQQVWIALQSVPAASSRKNVSIYYKELFSSKEDFKDAATFAQDWDGKYEVSSMGSAYSTMILKQDQHIGFFYEEDRYSIGGGYTMIYKDYTLERITDGAYSVRPENFNTKTY